MDEGTEALAREQETPAIEEQAPAPQGDNDELETSLENEEGEGEELEAGENEGEEGGEGEEGSEQEPELELVEIEVNGKKHKIPAELKDGFLMQADYTRKTQEVAEVRKTVEAKLAEAEQHFTVSQEVLEARATLLNVDHQLEQYQKVDWNQLEAEDPVGAMSHWRQFQQLEKAKGEISGFLNEQQTKRTEQAEQETANRLRETAEFARTKIPGWTDEVDAKITSFAEAELGFTRETLKHAYSPAVYKTLHLAWLGHQALSRQNAAPKPKAQATQPLTKVSGKSGTTMRAPEDKPMDEFAAWINKR